MTTTLILGGGFGGIACARALREQLPAPHRIVLVDRTPNFVVGATHTWVALGQRSVADVTRSRAALLPAGIETVEAEVRAIDPRRRTVETSAGAFAADHLVLALGADLDPAPIPGLGAAAHSFYTLDGAARLREALAVFDGGRVVLLVPRTPFKCPPAPYEAALLLHDAFERRGMRARVTLEIWTVEGAPMTTAGPEMGRLLVSELESRGIGFHRLEKAAEVDGAKCVVRFEGGGTAPYDLLIAVPPHRVPRVMIEAGLAEAGGWVRVDPETLEVRAEGVAPHVYAIGDLSAVPLPGRFDSATPLVLPKAGVFAAAHGEVVAARIAAIVRGSAATACFDGRGFCYIEVGSGRAMRGDGSFFDRPHPTMTRREPDERQYEDKQAWVRSWQQAAP